MFDMIETRMGIEQLALSLHIGSLAGLAVVVLYTDHLGLAWMRGTKDVLPLRLMKFLHQLVWVGLLLMLSSGFTMFLSYRDFLLFIPLFYAKMFCVAALVANAFFIGKFLAIAADRPFRTLTPEERRPLFISGVVSTIGWVGAISLGLILSRML